MHQRVWVWKRCIKCGVIGVFVFRVKCRKAVLPEKYDNHYNYDKNASDPFGLAHFVRKSILLYKSVRDKVKTYNLCSYPTFKTGPLPSYLRCHT